MNISIGKILWNIWSKFFGAILNLFLVSVLVFSILIIPQVKPDFPELASLAFPLLAVLSITRLMLVFPIWLQVFYLWAYFKFAQPSIRYFLSSEPVDYNFSWSLPGWIGSLFGAALDGKFIDFIFWSGFVLGILFLVASLESRLLVFLAKKMKISWANEIIEDRLKKALRNRGMLPEKQESGEKKISSPATSISRLPAQEKIVFKPKFFGDRLWYLPWMFLLMTFPVLFIMGWSFSSPAFSTSVLVVFGGSFFLFFFIFLPFLVWEASTRIILEKDKIIVKTFFFKKIAVLYSDIKNVGIGSGGVMVIFYEQLAKEKRKSGTIRFFPWPATTKKVLQELKARLGNINTNLNINDDFIVKKARGARSMTNVLGATILVGLVYAFLFYVIYQAKNRPLLSVNDCAGQLTFWISDKPKVGILETKEGFEPELNQKNPFYFWIKAKSIAPECKENVFFTIFDKEGKIIFQSNPLIPKSLAGATSSNKIGYYLFENQIALPENNDYLLKTRYENIPVKEIKFSVK